ncbi:MAG: Rab family GTPase [Candidatus Thorarchaeota archaeon]
MGKDNNGQEYESFYDLWERIKSEELTILPEESKTHIEENLFLDEQGGEYFMKIVLAGDGAVGKTSLRRSFLGEDFSFDYQTTIGADFATHREQIANRSVKFVIWDLAGQPQFHQVRKTFYSGAHGALVVCDLTNPTSFENLKHWINELWRYNAEGPVPFVIVGNKCDLRDLGYARISDKKIHSVTKIINEETSRKSGFGVKSITTSARTGEGVIEAFKQLAVQIIAHRNYIRRKRQKPE